MSNNINFDSNLTSNQDIAERMGKRLSSNISLKALYQNTSLNYYFTDRSHLSNTLINQEDIDNIYEQQCCDECKIILKNRQELSNWKEIHEILNKCNIKTDPIALAFGKSLTNDIVNTLEDCEGIKNTPNLSINHNCLIF